MKKIKRFWKENKVIFVLVIIILICLIVIVSVSIPYFYGSSESPYGDRLDDLKTKINDLDKRLNKFADENESIKSVDSNVKGRIAYISFTFNNETEIDEAKETVGEVLSLFSKKELKDYDLQFTISNNSFTLMGSKNAHGSEEIVWGNRLEEKDEKEETKEV